jgi:hypothetical protein
MLGRTPTPSVEPEDAVSTAVRIVRGLDTPDLAAFVRRIDLPSPAELDLPRVDLPRVDLTRVDLPRRFGSASHLAAQAGAALAGMLELLPSRRERRRSRRRTLVLGLLGVIGLAAAGTWLGRQAMGRRSAAAEARRLDQEAFERATHEGMGGAIGSADAVTIKEPVPLPMDMSVPDEDVVPSLEATRTERTVIDQATNGIGVAPRA